MWQLQRCSFIFQKIWWGVLKPLQEEMRMSESIFLPNRVAIIASFNLVSLHIKYIGHSLFFQIKWKKKSSWEVGFLLLYSVLWGSYEWKIYRKTLYFPSCHSQLLYIHLRPSLYLCLCVIYLSVCGRIDFRLYSRPLKPGGDSPCQAAGSNEKLKEHINSSIWGHKDENSCQMPARNNWSHNVALLKLTEVMRVKQPVQAQAGNKTASWRPRYMYSTTI